MPNFSMTIVTDVVSVSDRSPDGSVDGFFGHWYDGVDNHTGSTDEDLLNGTSSLLDIDFPGSAFMTVNLGATLTTGTIVYGFDHSTAIFILNGGSPISFNSLPSGFTVTSLQLQITTAGCVDIAGASATVSMNGVTVDYPTADGVNLFTITVPALVSPNTLTANELIDLIITFVGNATLTFGVCNPLDVESPGFIITGTYTTQSFQFTLDTPVDPAPGKKITLTSDPTDPTALPMLDVTEIHYTWNDGTDHEIIQPASDFELQYPNLLEFLIPLGFGDFAGTVTITATIESTEFSGSVSLGTMDILFENFSGIYKFTKNKKNDTLYDPARDGSTTNVKIPDPFGRTGFIGG